MPRAPFNERAAGEHCVVVGYIMGANEIMAASERSPLQPET
jgi:hypothetical protein